MDLDLVEIAILGKLYTLQDDVLTHLCTNLEVTKQWKTKQNLLKKVKLQLNRKPVVQSRVSIFGNHRRDYQGA